ncbi:DUF805 domain-containing protein [Vibrio sp. Isolate23]|uniref:DUF805 domain-containing protein n=1 Tax=unclassified Vibrio TaxID=2614977 RepID=UPI001EFD5062|nr:MULTISPECIES: DUF805 domain-containing protein [unclassified Vibrio]MCG9679856.1 DUF805 domain-containing protein [Vibrio sp. Isolate24]MCG9682597.1 DUF805 domain-containing protein [Vibrio sp. Isolate23]
MHFYWLAWKRGLDFSGHSSRQEFWVFMLVHVVVSLVFIAVDVSLSLSSFDVLYSIASFIPIIALVSRRMHDIGKSGYWGLVFFIPALGPFWLTYLLVQQGIVPESHGGQCS